MNSFVGRKVTGRLFFVNKQNQKLWFNGKFYGQCYSSILYSQIENVEIPNITIPEYIFKSFEKYPNKIALECIVTGKKYSFKDVRHKSLNISKNFRKILKLRKGDVIAIILPNVPELPVCLLGALQAGLITTTVNPSYTADEIARQLSDSNAKAIITLASTCPTVLAATKLVKKNIPILAVKAKQSDEILRGIINLHEFIEATSEDDGVPEIQAGDVALLPYSSGTTGLPKGVQLTHRNIVANLCQLSADELIHWAFPSETLDNVVPAILPMFHIYGITNVALTHLKSLSKIICVPKFTPEIFINVLEKHKPNVLYIVPSMVSFMSNEPLVKQEFFKPITAIVCGGAPLGKQDEERLLTKALKDIDVLQGFGLTETSPAVCMASATKKKKLGFTGSVGGLLPNTCAKLISTDDDHREICGPNELGEILVKGPQVMKGYLNRIEATNNAFLDGWLRTGDVGYYDDNEMFYITDRFKDLIKVSGFQVAPAELEEVIRGHKDVSEVCVIGIPSERFGEVPRAYVVPKLNSKINVEELKEYVSSMLIDYKHLRGGVALMNTLPRTASGKIARNDLRLQYASKLSET
ncbi:hypothetical protein RI129_007576 [Pyrocoelia pectoralis]|uniref:4-coumarate--CoA ligase n=1 Tax=Pyrocoelia pectoralis TaxID=417401 RepID=A0AAN7ZMS9_9COLE